MARVRKGLVQVIIVGAVVLVVVAFVLAIHGTLAKQGIGFGFGYLERVSGINISEGLGFKLDGLSSRFEAVDSSSTNGDMLVAGLFNTLKVAVLAIVASTILGVAIGVGRLSTNALIRKLSFAVVELIRNTPLLIQLVFWYFAVVLRFPPITAASDAYGVLIGQSGVYIPSLTTSQAANPLALGLLGLSALAFVVSFFFNRSGRLTGLMLAAVALAVTVTLGFPLELEFPVVSRFGATGGINMTPEMSAILLAITINSAGYTAEIVRGAINALAKGQWEAAASLGMSRGTTLKDIVLPQVFRVVLPSLGNRYISLTKDTSLGIAIGYPDLFNVNGTVSNQTGRNLEGVVIVMLTYLLLSWTISLTINVANNRLNKGGQR